MTNLLEKSETKNLETSKTKKLTADKTKKLEVSKTRGKKMKHSYDVKDTGNAILMKLKTGEVVIEMYDNVAPNHVKRIKELVREGFYNGIKFHRVIEGFMAQTGCPLGNGTGGSGQKLKAEFNNTPHTRGIVSMARAVDINSADSQFFICFGDTPHLDSNYTVWGKVISGMEHIDNIKKGEPYSGSVKNPDEIISMQVIADI